VALENGSKAIRQQLETLVQDGLLLDDGTSVPIQLYLSGDLKFVLLSIGMNIMPQTPNFHVLFVLVAQRSELTTSASGQLTPIDSMMISRESRRGISLLSSR
jgi:hypothetical protein